GHRDGAAEIAAGHAPQPVAATFDLLVTQGSADRDLTPLDTEVEVLGAHARYRHLDDDGIIRLVKVDGLMHADAATARVCQRLQELFELLEQVPEGRARKPTHGTWTTVSGAECHVLPPLISTSFVPGARYLAAAWGCGWRHARQL